MKKNNSLLAALSALKVVTQTLFKKMPVLFLVVVYLVDLGIRGYLAAGFSTTYLLGMLILTLSIGIYVSTRSFSETTLSFVLGMLTIYSIDWKKENISLFIILYLAYIVVTFCISSVRLAAKQESILTQAACKLDISNYKAVYNRLKVISEKSTKYSQLSILGKSEIIRYLAFRQVNIDEYEDAINIIELIKSVSKLVRYMLLPVKMVPARALFAILYLEVLNLMKALFLTVIKNIAVLPFSRQKKLELKWFIRSCRFFH